MLDMTSLIRRNRVGALAATAILVAACGSGGATTTPPTNAATQAPPSAATTTGPTAGASEAAAEAYEVELADSDTLGKVLTGEDGKTLYLFKPDTATTSACNTGCVDSWPPFTLEGAETVKGGTGVTGTFGTITRQDGGKQVTYNSHPLYYFSGDQAAGDMNGQGLNSKWYVVNADGDAVTGAQTGGKGTY